MRPTLRRKSSKVHPAALVVLVYATLAGAANAQQIEVQNGSGAPVKVKITAAEIAA